MLAKSLRVSDLSRWLCAGLLLFAIVVQVNDPDGWVWSVFYAAAIFLVLRKTVSYGFVAGSLVLAIWVLVARGFHPGGLPEILSELGGILIANAMVWFLGKKE